MHDAGVTNKGYGEFRRGWPVVLSAMLGIGLGLSPVPFYTIGVFAPVLAKQFHWGFGVIMAGLTINTVSVLVVSPVIGVLADRYGVRKVAIISVVLFGLSFMVFALGNGLLTLFYITWALMAVGGSGTLPITWTRAVNSWFDVRKGFALGLSLLGTGLFGFLIKPITVWLIAEVGWRAAYVAIGAMPLTLSLPVALLFFHDRDREPQENAIKVPVAGLTFAQTIREWRFWILAFAFVPISFAVGGPIPNMENILSLDGFDKMHVAELVPFIGLSVIFGRLIGGWLIDRIWAPAVAFALLSMPAIACWLLAHGPVAFGTALLSIWLIGFAAGVEYDLMAFLVARYFGMKSYATIYGSLYGCFALGAGVGPVVFGAAFDARHSYDTVLVVSAVVMVIGAGMLLTLGRYRDFGEIQSADILAAAEKTADALPT